VAVIGAGVSGLSASYHLVKNGLRDLTLFEKEQSVGGRIKTTRFGNAQVDVGAQFFLNNDSKIWSIVNEMNLRADCEEIHGFLSVYEREKLVPLDLKHAMMLTNNKEKLELIKFAISSLRINHNDTRLKEKTFMQWYNENIGSDMLWIFDSIFKSLSFSDASEISAAYGLLLSEVLMGKSFTFREGMQRLTNSIKDYLGSNNTTIYDHQEVTRIEIDQDEHVGITFGDERTEQFSHVISSVPSSVLSKLLDKNRIGNLSKIRYRSAKYVVLLAKNRLWDNPTDILFDEREVGFPLIVDESSKLGKSKKALFGVIVRGKESQSDDWIVDTVSQRISELFPNKSLEIINSKVFTWKDAMPICNPAMHRIQETVNPIMNRLYLCGDYLGYPALNSACESGELAAKRLLATSP